MYATATLMAINLFMWHNLQHSSTGTIATCGIAYSQNLQT
jgi:hypothetical protein